MSIIPGTYRARPIQGSPKVGFTKNGTEQVGVQLALLDADGVETDSTISWYGYFTDATSQRTMESLRYMGWQGDNLADLSTVGTKDCEIVIDWEEYQGNRSLRVKWVNATGRRTVAMNAEMDAGAAASFAQRMRGVVIAANGGKPSRPAAAPPRAGSSAPRPAPAPRPSPSPAPAPSSPDPSDEQQPPPDGFEDDIPF